MRMCFALCLMLLAACPKSAQPGSEAPPAPAPTPPPTAEATAAAPAAAPEPAPTVAAAPASTAGNTRLCEMEWPAQDKPEPEVSLRCAAYWLRYGYGEEYKPEDLSLDPACGGPISTGYTAEQFLRMQAHVRAAAKTKCDDVEKEPVACRAIGYFAMEADSHQNLMDPWRLQEIHPLLGKVLKGKPVSEADLAPASPKGQGWSAVTLWRLRNAVFARHGRAFTNPDLQRFFYGEYPPDLTKGLLPLKVDPAFNDARLTTVDRANIKLLKKHESKRWR